MTTQVFLTDLSSPHRLHAGACKIIVVSPPSMFIATAPFRLLPTIRSGFSPSLAAPAKAMARQKNQSESLGVITS